jgi:hypothetical protein
MCEDAEVYTVRVDSVLASSDNSFISYINVPLRNVIKAELIFASLASNVSVSNVAYVYIMELDSKFNDRADVQTKITNFCANTSPPFSNVGTGLTGTISNVNYLRNSIVCFPLNQDLSYLRSIYTLGGFFPTNVQFIEPIRQVQQLTVSLYGEKGQALTTVGPTFLTLRFTCAKRNVCQYYK